MSTRWGLSKVGVRAYLFLALTLASAVPVGWLGYTQAQRWAEVAVEDADHYSSAAARSLSVQLSTTMHNSIRSVEALSSQARLAGSLDAKTLLPLLRAHRGHYPEFSALYVADAQARSVALVTPKGETSGGTDYRDRDYYQQLLRTGKTSISRVQIGKSTHVPNVQIAAPFFSADGKLLGYAEGSLDLRPFAEQAKAALAGLGRESRVVVLDGEGRVLADSGASNVHLKDLSDVRLFGEVFSPSGDLRTGLDEYDRPVRASAVAMDGPLSGWRVVALKSQSVVEARARQARWQGMTAAALAFVAALIIAGLVASWLSRPIQALAALTQEVRDGATDVSQPVRAGPREIVQLTDATWEMIQQLSHHAEGLEELVEARTQQLTRVNSELELFAIAIKHAGEAIEVTDADGKYVFVNPAFEKLTGYSSLEALGKRPEDLLGETEPVARPGTEGASGPEVQRGTQTSFRKDGAAFEQEVTFAAIKDARGKPVHWVGLRRDVTELRNAQEALRVRDRMASVGTLAAGVAHEINNPLAYVTTNLQFAVETVRKTENVPAEMNEALMEALDGAARVNAIMQGLKIFSSPDDDQQGPIDVNQILDAAIKMVSTEIRHRAHLRRELEAVPTVYGNASKLGQVLLNLLVNAAQAIDEGNTAGNEIRVRTRVEAEMVVIQVTDTGKGMDQETKARVFDPFYTTKPIGEGTGLGLSICHSVITSMGGEITISSRPSLGTTFTIRLPASKLAPRAAVEFPLATQKEELRGRVLVIDDDAHVARSLERILRAHDVRVATNGRDGLTALRHGTYDVVLCDLMMPDLTGMELFDIVKDELPASLGRMVFMTGGTFTAKAREFADTCPAPIMEKPFSPVELRNLVQQYAKKSHAA